MLNIVVLSLEQTLPELHLHTSGLLSRSYHNLELWYECASVLSVDSENVGRA